MLDSIVRGSHATEYVGDRSMELNCTRQLYDYNRWAQWRILAMAAD